LSPYNVVLTHSHVLFRDGLREILQKVPDLEVVGAAGDGDELFQVLKGVTPDLIIVDIVPPIMNGLITVQEIKKKNPQTKILLLCTHCERPFVLDAFKYGADGYLLKDDSSGELIKAVETLRNESLYVSPFFSNKMFENPMEVGQASSPAEKPHVGRPVLKAQRQKIIDLIADGKTTGEIAAFLNLSPRTVEHHRERIKKELKVSSTADLIKYALEAGRH
jgi:DNA-binding NarL/FixJ family response regulator